MVKFFVFLFFIFMNIIMYFKFKIRLSTVLFCFISETIAFIFLQNGIFYSFFVSFLFIGILKIISHFTHKKSDLHTYKISNFIYNAAPAIFYCILLFIIEKLDYNNMSLLLKLLIIVNLVTVVSDTSSSEIGQFFNVKTYSIINMKKVCPGTDGGVSIIGTLGSLLYTLVYIIIVLYINNLGLNFVFILLIISFIANVFDSILGATLQYNNIITNEQTNLISILLSCFLSFCLFKLWRFI